LLTTQKGHLNVRRTINKRISHKKKKRKKEKTHQIVEEYGKIGKK